ncbi:hypothetical protein P9112_008999 [Eukaryota sp. TZLM1-RC]
MAHLGSLLAIVFAVRFSEDSHFLTQHQFWIQCRDFVAVSKPKVRHPFNRLAKPMCMKSSSESLHHGRRNHALLTSRPLQQLVVARCRQLQGNYQQLLADGLVSWKLNFFCSYAVGHNCPAPATYASSVLNNNTNFREPLLSWFNTHHTMAVTLFNFLVGDPQRRQKLTPIASLKPAFVPVSTWVLNYFISKNTSQTIMKNPYLFFKTRANDYTMSFNGDSVRITFKPHPKATQVRLSGEALTDERFRGELDHYETIRNRKHTLQAKVERHRPRQKPKATERQAPDDETDMVFWAIDPNHSNLCGANNGTRSGPTVSNIFLTPKQRKTITPLH